MTPKLALCSESTLTVRKALGLNKRDKICYTIQPNGKVWISRVAAPDSDPVLEGFLSFLEQDMEKILSAYNQ